MSSEPGANALAPLHTGPLWALVEALRMSKSKMSVGSLPLSMFAVSALGPRYNIIKQLSVGDHLKHVRGTLNNLSIHSYGGLPKLMVRSKGACATTMTQIYLP